MSIEFRPARRENVPLLLGVAGGTGSGKTYSALRIARGIAAGQPFAGIDTENRRMSHYADAFPELRIGQLEAPFRPDRYAQAIADGERYLVEQGVPLENRVVVVDSASHEWAGDGGCLDWHDELTGGDDKKKAVAWAKVKPAHKKMVTRLLQLQAHVILCFRAEPKIDIVRENGQVKFVPKQSVTGLDGWIPISEKMLPYELTASFLLMAEAPGIPKPIKLEEQHKPFVALDRVLDEEAGRRLAEWARGGAAKDSVTQGAETVVSPPEEAAPLDQTASSATAFTPPPGATMPEALTNEQFKALCREYHIHRDQVSAVGRELFPGKTPAKLTDAERGTFWKALQGARQEALT